MVSSTRFFGLVVLQLCIPAALYLAVGLYPGNNFGLAYLLPNYFFMALPLLLVSLFTIWSKSRRTAVLWVLSLLNLLLIAFQLWVLLVVPRNESGLAWIFYVPLWGSALLVFVITWFVAKHVGARQSVGT
jgi:hypothetical protein